MAKTYIAYTKKNRTIKVVSVEYDGEIDELGIQLSENFVDLVDVMDVVRTSISDIKDGEVNYADELDESSDDRNEYSEYDSKADFMEDLSADTYYYLFEKDNWYVCKPNQSEFQELDVVIEEEF
jgi:hypothetical protein